jgi:hypothetical protein
VGSRGRHVRCHLPASPVTSGPYGSIPSFETFLPGWFDVVPPAAATLARLTTNNAPALALIPAGALAPSSGGVVVCTDTSMIFDQFATPADLAVVLNAIFLLGPPPPFCYANCDESQVCPVLNVNDFVCFLIRFAQADPYANCDGSTTPPVLNVNDFQCFINRFAVGCP